MRSVAESVLELEWVERLPEFELGARWHVREGGVSRVAWVMHELPYFDTAAMTAAANDWCGFQHPRASSIRHVGRYDGRLMVVVDDDRGPTVADAAAHLAELDRARTLEHESWLVAQFVTLADAIDAMAKRRPGFVYRDLDPSRLFVDHTGRGRLRAPVGIVELRRSQGSTGAGYIFGTPYGMSPEHALGQKPTPASDVFALATAFVHAISGVQPFDDEHGNYMGVLQNVLVKEPAMPALHTKGLAAVLARAFARKPTDRISHPGALAAELYACVPDAGDHDAVTSDRLAMWWPTAPQAAGPMPAERSVRCAKTWAQLAPMERVDMRYCHDCKQAVVQVRSLAAAIPLVGNTCINYQPPE